MEKLIDADASRKEFMDEVYHILANDATNDRANEIIDVFDSLPAADVEPVRKWIPVEESMPPEKTQHMPAVSLLTGDDVEKEYIGSDLVLVTVEDDSGNLFVSDDITVDGKWYNYDSMNVVAWMPLQEPYRAEGGESNELD